MQGYVIIKKNNKTQVNILCYCQHIKLFFKKENVNMKKKLIIVIMTRIKLKVLPH